MGAALFLIVTGAVVLVVALLIVSAVERASQRCTCICDDDGNVQHASLLCPVHGV